MLETTKPVRIFVVEDYEPFRRFVCESLQARPELQVIAEASDGLQAVQKAEELKPDLIVMDIGIPGLNGIEASKRISTLVPGTIVLFLSQETDVDVVDSALCGAKGYVQKANASRELLPAIEAVLEGQRFVGSGVMQRSPNLSSYSEWQADR